MVPVIRTVPGFCGWALLFCCPAMLHAGIVSTGGDVYTATPPANIKNGFWEDNNEIRAFAEQQNLLLPSDLPLDISTPGTSPSAIDSHLSPLTIPAGTVVNSYQLHFDIVGTRTEDRALQADGNITFSNDILGLIVLSSTLNSTNAVLGLYGITYADGTNHGLGLNPGGGGNNDSVTLSANRRTISMALRDSSNPDDFRVITAVPEPVTAAIVALLAATFMPQRQRRA